MQISITHEEARSLIQFRADGKLKLADETRLDKHLEECADCRDYLNKLENTVSILQKTLQKQWKANPLPLQMGVVYGRMASKKRDNVLLTMRMSLVGVAFVLLSFMAWQYTTSGRYTSQQYSSSEIIPLIPTPSAQHTATNTSLNDCQNIKYSVQQGDTVEDIARQFSVPSEAILLANNLTNTSLASVQELVIPICDTTPTSTTHPPTFTITPIFEPVTTTPG